MVVRSTGMIIRGGDGGDVGLMGNPGNLLLERDDGWEIRAGDGKGNLRSIPLSSLSNPNYLLGT